MIELALREEKKVADAIVDCLVEAGVDLVFTMPGGKTIRILDSLFDAKNRIRTVMVRDEEISTIMAEAYGRLTGRPAVAMGQAAFLLSKAGIGIIEAFQGSTPMLVLTDLSDGAPYSHHGPYQSATGDYGSWDAARAFGAYTKRTMVSHFPGEAVQHVQLGLKHAMTGEQGPVAVCFHSAVFDGKVGPATTPEIYSSAAYLGPARTRLEPNGSAVRALAPILAAAKAPVIIAGNGVRLSQAYSALEGLAERLGAPVVTTATGKGVLREDHPLALGVIGNYGRPAAIEAVGGADLVLALGTKLSPNDTIGEHPGMIDPTRQTIVQIDVEPLNVSWSVPVSHFLIGDVRLCLEALLEALEPGAPSDAGRAKVEAARARHGYYGREPAAIASQTDQSPQRIVSELSRCLPQNSVVACDAGENRLFMMHYFQVRNPGAYLQPGSSGGMGFALPAAMGAKLAMPDSLSVAVCGDGGFAMSMPALLTAIEEKIPILVVVLNNNALGWVKNIQMDRAIAVDFAVFDYAAIARAIGCHAERIDGASGLAEAVGRAIAAGQPAVIEVATSLEVSHKDITSAITQVPRRH